MRYKLERILQNAIYGAVFYAVEEREINVGGTWLRRRDVAIKMLVRQLVIEHKGETQEDILAEVNFRDKMTGHPNVLTYDLCWYVIPGGRGT